MPPRAIAHRYDDPLDLVWLDAAAKLGMRVERSGAAYASWDGCSTLSVARHEDLDPDDSLAQLIFHEICHALVAGPAGRSQLDWGLDNQSERDLVFEHACHRVQAAIAARHGLRDFFAVTTEWRPYWEALPSDPIAPSDDPAVPLARAALARADAAPYAAVLAEAMASTASIADVVRGLAPADSLFRTTRARHPSGFLQNPDSGVRCGACAWSHAAGGRALRCRQASRAGRESLRVFADTLACERYEPKLSAESCRSCGACCREGFDRVDVRPRDAIRKHHPMLVHEDTWGLHLPRPGGRCVALDTDAEHGHRCRVYPERPKSCREFAVGGDACLEARRRVGLSR
jgi:hypothetical protein